MFPAQIWQAGRIKLWHPVAKLAGVPDSVIARAKEMQRTERCGITARAKEIANQFQH